MSSRPPLPPFDHDSAVQKVRMAENAWNSRNPDIVTPAYSATSRWRNRASFVTGHAEIHALLNAKWQREHDYRLIKELWAFAGNRIAVRFAYEYHDGAQNWVRAYGNENWEFDADGRMAVRHASINDLAITEGARLFHWPAGPRPDDHASLSELGL